MGTRSLTHVIETWKDDKTGKKKKACIMTMYRQYDGYPSGMGNDLAEFLNKGKLVNGISVSETALVFNGVGCLSAQIVAHFKEGPGGIYLYKPMSKDCGEEYTYEIEVDYDTRNINFKCYEIGYTNKKGDYVNKKRLLYNGSPSEYSKWLEKYETA